MALESTRRDEMAKATAPYVHATLAAVDATLQANLDGSVTFTWLPPPGSERDPRGVDPEMVPSDGTMRRRWRDEATGMASRSGLGR